jgi:hypothetical protein
MDPNRAIVFAGMIVIGSCHASSSVTKRKVSIEFYEDVHDIKFDIIYISSFVDTTTRERVSFVGCKESSVTMKVHQIQLSNF